MTQSITESIADPLISYRQYCQGQLDCKSNKSRQSDNNFYQLGYTETLASKLSKDDIIYYSLATKDDYELSVKAQLYYKVGNFFWHVIDIKLAENDDRNQRILDRELKKTGSSFIHISKIRRYQHHGIKHT